MQDLILSTLSEPAYRPMTDSELVSALDIPREQAVVFLHALDRLTESGKIIKSKKGKYLMTNRCNLVIGILSKNIKGYGFILTESDDKGDVFIPPSFMNFAMHGDRVIAELITREQDAGDRREGRITTILRHARHEIVGTFYLKKRFGIVVPDDVRAGGDLFIGKNNMNGALHGEKVLVRIVKWPTAVQKAEGHVVERLGMAGDPSVDLKCLIRQHHLSDRFPEKVLREADTVPTMLSEDDLTGRTDLRNETIITIDGADAKDLDDAVSVRRLPSGNYLLGVHIADVSHYVREGSKLDREALRRGCSVYLIDTVLPMLPQSLSNGICSLHPGVDRLTLSIEAEIDPSGKTVAHRIFESVICSKERMTYTDVSDILEHGDQTLIGTYRHIHEDLTCMDELYRILSNARTRRGSIDFDFDESSITLNEDGLPVDVKVLERRSANKLIEEFMIKANEIIAEHHFWLDIPFVYRVHETPDLEKMDAFRKFVTNFGYLLKGSSERIHPKALNDLVQAVADTPHAYIINTVLLRTMRKAVYLPECKGHFGLGLKYYCHFTSPIRRYPDLIIHRIIKESSKQSLHENRKAILKGKVEEASTISSETERAAQEIERELEKLKKAQYMETYLGECFDGVVSGITSFGIFVLLPNTVEGVTRFHDMHDDYYVFEKEKHCAVGNRSGKTYTPGDMVRVRVAHVDLPAREISFALLD